MAHYIVDLVLDERSAELKRSYGFHGEARGWPAMPGVSWWLGVWSTRTRAKAKTSFDGTSVLVLVMDLALDKRNAELKRRQGFQNR